MPRAKVGERVGAIVSASKEEGVKFLGFGVYEGDHIPDEWAKGQMAAMCRQAKVPAPRIRLDSGRLVYGFQCWWGPADEVQKRLDHFGNVQVVSPDDLG